jgi:hypothetical protein
MWPFSKWREQLFRLLKPTDAYYRHWVRFRIGLLMQIVVMILFVPIFLIFTSLFRLVLQPVHAQIAGVGTAIFVAFILDVIFPLTCPRCQMFFFGAWWPQQDAKLMERCINCGLQLYAPNNF